MKFAFSLLLLVAYANAGPIPSVPQNQVQTAPVIGTPSVIVGSSQVGSKSDGRVTLHLDQRSQVGQETIPVVGTVERTQTQADVPKVAAPQPAQITESQPQDPVLTARNEVSRSKPEIQSPSGEAIPAQIDLTGRNQVQTSPIQQVSTVSQAIQSQVVDKIEPLAEKPILVEQVLQQREPAIVVVGQEPAVIPVISSEPAIIPVVSVGQDIVQSVQPVLLSETVPQTIIQQAITAPEGPRVEVIVPVVEPIPAAPSSPQERSKDVIGRPLSNVQETIIDQGKILAQQSQQTVTEDKVETKQKQAESQARNLKVDQTPVKAPVVVASVQKQAATVDEKLNSDKVQTVVATEPKLEGKHAIVPQAQSESTVQRVVEEKPQVLIQPVQVQPIVQTEPQVQVPKIVLQERRSEEVIATKPAIQEVQIISEPRKEVQQTVEIPAQSNVQVEPIVQAQVPKSEETIVIQEKKEQLVEPIQEVVAVQAPTQSQVDTQRADQIVREPVKVQSVPVAKSQ